jgi:hypothetical protein
MNRSIEDLRGLLAGKKRRELKPLSTDTRVPLATILNFAKGRTKHPRVDTFSDLCAGYDRLWPQNGAENRPVAE